MKLEDIQRHWNDSGKEFPFDSEVTPTSRDPFLGELERDRILSQLLPEQMCLEIGCGDGFHSVHYAKKVKQLVGLDVAESLLAIAEKRLEEHQITNMNLIQGSVTEVASLLEKHSFDCVISQRCLINLPNWEDQRETLLQVKSLLKEGGLFLMTEAFQDRLDQLNVARVAMGLSEINTVAYNHNFTQPVFEDFIQSHFHIEQLFSYGAYLFLSRVLHPLAVLPDAPKHDARLNQVAMEMHQKLEMPDFDKYSYNLCYVLRRR